MANKFTLKEINKLQDRPIFFDANILIYLFWPTGRHYFETSYAHTFFQLLKQGNPLFIDFSIISEIVNSAIRSEYEKHLLKNGLTKNGLKYKDYRDSQDGQDSLRDIYVVVEEQILNRFDVVGKIYTKDMLKTLLVVDHLDFVDKSIVQICHENKFVLLTNDKDFKKADIDLLSGNKHLLT